MIWLLAAIVLGAVAGGRRTPARQAFLVNRAAEIEACRWAWSTLPRRYEGRRQAGMPDLEWFSRVAFRRAYGFWADDNNVLQAGRLAQICVGTVVG